MTRTAAGFLAGVSLALFGVGAAVLGFFRRTF